MFYEFLSLCECKYSSYASRRFSEVVLKNFWRKKIEKSLACKHCCLRDAFKLVVVKKGKKNLRVGCFSLVKSLNKNE